MWQEDLVGELNSAKPAERKAVIVKFATLTGHTPQHLYRVAKANGFDAGRKERDDKGTLVSGLSRGQVEFVASLVYVTGRENKGPIMPVERALQIAEDNGIIEPGRITPAGLTRLLREWLISKRHIKAPEPHVNMRSLHPNHTHVFDVSVCIQYYLKNGRMGIMDERDFYKNKPHNFEKVKTRLLRYVVVDHFSGAFFYRYYDTTGETQDNLYAFLKEAWAPKADAKLPFRGVPFNLLMDNGSANSSKAIVAMLERLGVNIPKGKPYNPQRQGAVETMHETLEAWFESGLRIQPAFDVETLNTWANDWSIRFQATKAHTRTGMPRTQCWLMIRREELRELPSDDILQDLFANPEEDCLVYGDYSIKFRGKVFGVKHVEGLAPRMKIKAILKPFKWPDDKIDVAHNGAVYECSAIDSLPAALGGFRVDAAIIGADYTSQPETETQRAKKRFDNMAFGEAKKKGAIPFEGLKVFGHHADAVDSVAFMPKTGTPMELDRAVVPARISITEFFKELRNAIGAITPELNAEIRERHGETIDRKEAEEEIRRQRDAGEATTDGEAKKAVGR